MINTGISFSPFLSFLAVHTYACLLPPFLSFPHIPYFPTWGHINVIVQ